MVRIAAIILLALALAGCDGWKAANARAVAAKREREASMQRLRALRVVRVCGGDSSTYVLANPQRTRFYVSIWLRPQDWSQLEPVQAGIGLKDIC